MIPISLLGKTPIGIFTSNENVAGANRVGDIILLSQESNLDSRPPWNNFGASNEWLVRYGSALPVGEHNRDRTLVSLSMKEWDIDRVMGLYNRQLSFSIALIQQNSNNGFQAAVSTECTLSGCRIDESDIQLHFYMPNCEMIYDK